MPAPAQQKNQNSLNVFLNNYFRLILVIFTIILLIVAYFIILRPKYESTKQAIRAELDQQQLLYAQQQRKLNTLRTLYEFYRKIPSADLKKFNGVLPDQYVKERLYGELSEIVSSSGFILSRVELIPEGEGSPAAPQGNAKVGVLQIRISVASIDYNGLKNLLRLLESNLRLYDVVDVQFSPSGNSAQLIIATYYYKS